MWRPCVSRGVTFLCPGLALEAGWLQVSTCAVLYSVHLCTHFIWWSTHGESKSQSHILQHVSKFTLYFDKSLTFLNKWDELSHLYKFVSSTVVTSGSEWFDNIKSSNRLFVKDSHWSTHVPFPYFCEYQHQRAKLDREVLHRCGSRTGEPSFGGMNEALGIMASRQVVDTLCLKEDVWNKYFQKGFCRGGF